MNLEIERDIGHWQRTYVEAEAMKRLFFASQAANMPCKLQFFFVM
jgi:hypothetical protein